MTTMSNSFAANPPKGHGGGKIFAPLLAGWTREGTTTAYASLDVIGDDAAGSCIIEFAGSGHSGAIRTAQVIIEETDTITPRLFLFDTEPSAHLDNAALALADADMPYLVAVIDFDEADKILIGGGNNIYPGSGKLDENIGLPMPYASTTGSLYGLLQTVPGFTPASASKYYVRLGVEING